MAQTTTPAQVSRRPLRLGWAPAQQVRMWTGPQWKVAGRTYLVALLLMGILGETLPGASWGRKVPVEWWNYVTLAISPVLIGLIAATFVTEGQSRRSRRIGKTGTGAGATVATLAMACPACNPLAIVLFGTSGVLSFLAPERGLIALASAALLLLTLFLRLRTTRACQIRYVSPQGPEQDGRRPAGDMAALHDG